MWLMMGVALAGTWVSNAEGAFTITEAGPLAVTCQAGDAGLAIAVGSGKPLPGAATVQFSTGEPFAVKSERSKLGSGERVTIADPDGTIARGLAAARSTEIRVGDARFVAEGRDGLAVINMQLRACGLKQAATDPIETMLGTLVCCGTPAGVIVFLLWAIRSSRPRFKICPDCRERARESARVCPHCNYEFKVRASPRKADGDGLVD